MKIPKDALIAEEKLTHYLLIRRDYDDKSKFLSQSGFNLKNPKLLMNAIRYLVGNNEARVDGQNEWGAFYRVDGYICGPLNVTLEVITIWLECKFDGKFRFITLKPKKGSCL